MLRRLMLAIHTFLNGPTRDHGYHCARRWHFDGTYTLDEMRILIDNPDPTAFDQRDTGLPERDRRMKRRPAIKNLNIVDLKPGTIIECCDIRRNDPIVAEFKRFDADGDCWVIHPFNKDVDIFYTYWRLPGTRKWLRGTGPRPNEKELLKPGMVIQIRDSDVASPTITTGTFHMFDSDGDIWITLPSGNVHCGAVWKFPHEDASCWRRGNVP